MSRKRKEIRERLVALIKRGRTRAGDNVSFQSNIKQEIKNLPAINLFLTSEEVEEFSTGTPRTYRRKAFLSAEILSSRKTETQTLDELDDIAADVEDLLVAFSESKLNQYGKDTAGNTCYLVNKIDIAEVNYELDEDGESPVGALRVTFTLDYFEDVPKFTTPIDDYLTSEVDWKHDDVIEDDQASDLVNLPQ